MVGKIFQIEKQPISEDGYITPDDFCESRFLETSADYILDNDDRDEGIQALQALLQGRNISCFRESDSSFVILPGGREAYFAPAYKAFVDAREASMKMGLTEFANDEPHSDFSYILWRMNNYYCSKVDSYISSEEFGIIPLDKFIRQAELGARYYIGGVLNYHC